MKSVSEAKMDPGPAPVPIRRVGIVAKQTGGQAVAAAKTLIPRLKERGAEVVVEMFLRDALQLSDLEVFKDPIPALDLLVVMGGDGTMLHAARLINHRSIPILGVNLGSLGFLTEITVDELYDVLDRIYRGEAAYVERMTLNVRIVRESRDFYRATVLNDVVINKGALARMVDLETYVGGLYLSSIKADGLIVSTPTGSTGYSLAAGGPIVWPSMEAVVIAPICPHMLTNRPLLIPRGEEIRVRLGNRISDLWLTLDGQVGLELRDRDQLIINVAEERVRLIQTPDRDYFEVLRTKLKWGER